MPILWRYLLRSYFQVFLLCVLGFIGVLLVTRFRDIASFATTGAGWGSVGLFTLYQIPYILPIAIPISGLIASILLLKRLSHAHELTAFRASGLNIRVLIFPLLLSAAFLSLVNFTVVSELGPICKARSKHLVYEIAMVNPLALFQKDSPLHIKNTYVDIKTMHAGKHAEDVILVLRNLSNGHLGLMTAKDLWIEEDSLLGKEVSFISSLDPKKENSFDHLVIENQAVMSTKASNLSHLIEMADIELHYDYLPLRLILAKLFIHKHSSGYKIGKGELEIIRRLTLSLAAFSFTLIGIAFGMEIGRNRSKKGLFWAIGLGAFFMICFIGAKSFQYTPSLAAVFYLFPHCILLFFSCRAFQKVSRGIE